MTEKNLVSGSMPIVTKEEAWPNPISLVEKSIAATYPIDALPTIIQNAIAGYQLEVGLFYRVNLSESQSGIGVR
jgi:hypothetical protein